MASNLITKVIPKILAQGMMVLRQNCITPRLVANMTSSIAGKKGSTIDVPVPSAIAATDVTPAATAPVAGALAPDTIPVVLDKWKEAAFDLSDSEFEQVMDGTIPMQAEEAVKAICNAVDSSLLALYVNFFGFHGTAGTTPFANVDTGVADAVGIRKVLNNQHAPMEPRHVILNPDAEANALSMKQFADMTFSGTVGAMRDGQLNRKLGMDWWMNQNIPIHVRNAVGAGALTANGVNNPATPLNAQTISIAKGAGANWIAKKGDLITIAFGGTIGTKQFVILNDPTVTITQAANTPVTIAPNLPAATAGGEVITSIDTHTVNLAFHRDAIAFANRPLLSVPEGLGSLSLSQVDPISGLALRVEVTREFKRTRWSYDFLWGCAVPRRELGARLLG